MLEVFTEGEFVIHLCKTQFIMLINALHRLEPIDTSSESYRLGDRFNSAFDRVGKGVITVRYNESDPDTFYSDGKFYLEINRHEFMMIFDAIEALYEKEHDHTDDGKLYDLYYFVSLAFIRLADVGKIVIE